VCPKAVALVSGVLYGKHDAPYPNIAVIGAAHEHLLAALADVHAIDHLFMAWMPSYPLSSFYIPARQMHICGSREQHLCVPRPMQIQDCLLVAGQDAIVLTISSATPEYYCGLDSRSRGMGSEN